MGRATRPLPPCGKDLGGGGGYCDDGGGGHSFSYSVRRGLLSLCS